MEQGLSCNYYLFDDILYEIESERVLCEYGYKVAELTDGGIEVCAFWHNGDAYFSECIERALNKLEG